MDFTHLTNDTESSNSSAPKQAFDETIISVLYGHVLTHPDSCILRWVNEKGDLVDSLTYAELWSKSGQVVALLQRERIEKGDRVMVAFLPGLEYIPALIGCMRAGVIACSVYPPNPLRGKHSFAQFNKQAKDAGASFALTTHKFKLNLMASVLKGNRTHVKWLATDNLKSMEDPIATKLGMQDQELIRSLKSSDIAFIQYTSGSTNFPKGVMLTHAAIASNLSQQSYTQNKALEKLERGREAVVASWLPCYHDYGLFVPLLLTIYNLPVSAVLMSPMDFIKNPLLYVEVIERYDASMMIGPNFGYMLLGKRMKAANRKVGVKVVLADVSAEPIDPRTLDVMKETIGIDESAIHLSYGMAECCLMACDVFSEKIVVDKQENCVGVGQLSQASKFGVHFLVVDPSSKSHLEDGSIGMIYLASPSLASGYWKNQEASKSFSALVKDGIPFLETGDVGMIKDGLLFVTGRHKELIIINGKNIYPTDLERTVENEFPEVIRPGSSVAFQSTASTAGIAVEIRKTARRSMGQVS
jgi:acyl-CoA synthetase (AMP-forming)/AMP-acid ligase II